MLTRDQIKAAWADNTVRMTDTPETLLVQSYRYWRQKFRFNPDRLYSSASACFRAAGGDVAASKRRYPGPRSTGYNPISRQPDNPHLVHIDEPESNGFRYVGRADPDPRGNAFDTREEYGWFTDPYCDHARDGTGLCYGVVYQLAGRKGVSRFVAGYEFGGFAGGPTLDLSEVYEEPRGDYYAAPQDLDAAQDAARAADSMAERAAEDEREYQTAWQAGSRWADTREEIEEARGELREILKERKAARGSDAFPALCAAIRARVFALRDQIEESRKERDQLAAGDFRDLIFWPGDDRLCGAFNEGAGESVFG